ncbi:MAG: exodeoxyribonuclease VII large subunit [Verrucomicrobia bacterium]|nr:exodeoxyribonuclease VII large subunit [Verrucomicrobiota bacterium]
MSQILSVYQLTLALKDVLEGRFGSVWVEGEISNYRRQSSGHHYFTLKDNRAQLACVMFARSYGAQSRIALADGVQVQAFGQVTVYEARGQYQLVVQLIQRKGLGLLQAKFEALKRKLEAEGLFASELKRPLPKFPIRVALVTSPSGAVVQDMLNVLRRRSPWLSILICPVRVQGEGAAEEIAAMIDYLSSPFNRIPIDVLIVGRGGGSLEDLWEFNEEALARAIRRSRIPVVSAVGHEVDYTIADFVADFRAPTPSAAAELVVPDGKALHKQLALFATALERRFAQILDARRQRLRRVADVLAVGQPGRLLRERVQRIDALEEKLKQSRTLELQRRRSQLEKLCALLVAHRPERWLEAQRKHLDMIELRLKQSLTGRLKADRNRIFEFISLLRLLGPMQTLQRGYSITTTDSGHVVQSAAELAGGDHIRTRFFDGTLGSVVDDREPHARN